MNTAPILTAEDAELAHRSVDILAHEATRKRVKDALAALRDRRTYCAPVRSEEELREMFQSVIGAPPYEHMCDRGGPESAWPGQYKRYETQLAWETWLACARAIQGGV